MIDIVIQGFIDQRRFPNHGFLRPVERHFPPHLESTASLCSDVSLRLVGIVLVELKQKDKKVTKGNDGGVD